ncbi:MAG: UDP-2,4-diacetamido-2,4,6-trideoxy-beta-L-altropyranose hydrolase, partial [Kiloniellales bacterium]
MEPSSSRTVVFRADAAPWIGAGHVARCLSLAETFGAEGWRCRLACRAGTLETAPAIARCFRETLILEGVEEDEARAIAARWPEGCDLLVVDHYGRAAPFEEALRPWARAILAIDDLCRAHTCDYLLDPTPGRTAGDYAGRVPQGCEVYLGPAYVPLKSVFAERRARALARRRKPGPVERILVSLGATDPDNLTALALGGIVRSGLKPAVEIVLGPVAPHREEVRAQAAALDLDVTVHEGLEDMAALMARADLAIGAAGITSWERCCLGLPSVLVVTADNQRRVAEALERAGAAVSLGWHSAVGPERIAAAVMELDRDSARRARMGAKAAALC